MDRFLTKSVASAARPAVLLRPLCSADVVPALLFFRYKDRKKGTEKAAAWQDANKSAARLLSTHPHSQARQLIKEADLRKARDVRVLPYYLVRTCQPFVQSTYPAVQPPHFSLLAEAYRQGCMLGVLGEQLREVGMRTGRCDPAVCWSQRAYHWPFRQVQSKKKFLGACGAKVEEEGGHLPDPPPPSGPPPPPPLPLQPCTAPNPHRPLFPQPCIHGLHPRPSLS